MKTSKDLSKNTKGNGKQELPIEMTIKKTGPSFQIGLQPALILTNDDEIWGVPTCCLDFEQSYNR